MCTNVKQTYITNAILAAFTSITAISLFSSDNVYAACPAGIDTASNWVLMGGNSCVWTPPSTTIDRTVGWTSYITVGQTTSSGGSNSLTVDPASPVTFNITPTGATAGMSTWGIRVVAPPTETNTVTVGDIILNLNNDATPVANVQATGIEVTTSGSFTGNDVTINVAQRKTAGLTTAYYSYGLLVGGSVNAGSYDTTAMATATFKNLTISADSSQTTGQYANNVTTAAIRAISQSGTYSSGSGTVIVTDQTTINTAGNYSIGIYVSGKDSTVDINNSKITTAGSTSSAIKIGKTRDGGNGGGRLISRGHMDIDTTNAAGAASILLLGDGNTSTYRPATLDADFDTSSTIIRSAAEAVNYTVNDKGTYGSSDSSTVSFNNARVSTTSNTASLIKFESSGTNYAQTNAVFNLRGSQSLLTAANNGWLFEAQANTSATANISKNAVLQGMVTTGTNGTFVMNLSDSAVWQLAPKGTTTDSTLTTLNLLSGATLNTSNGDYRIIGDVNSTNGIIKLSESPTNAGRTLTIKGNYVGNNGKLLIDTVLGDDGSVSDMLVIDGGQASGNTSITVTNANGLGAATTGDGIHVIGTANGGTTTTNAFTQSGNIEVGAYRYTLVRGGTSTPDDWYLTSQYTKPDDPPPPNGPAQVYVTAPGLATRMGLAMLGTYHDRAGEDFGLINDRTREQPTYTSGAWGRIFSETGKNNTGSNSVDASGHSSKFDKNGSAYDFDLSGFQTGLDIYRNQQKDYRITSGAYISVARANADVDDLIYGRQQAGTLNMDGYSLGGYWTRKTDTNWYVDAVAQFTHYDNIKGNVYESMAGLSNNGSTNGWGFAGSIESGYPFQISETITIEPQAQLIYQHITLDDITTQASTRISYDNNDNIIGRIGARATKAGTTNNGRDYMGWLRFNVWNSFGNDGKITLSQLDGSNAISYGSSLGDSWLQFGIGFSGQFINKNGSVFIAADYNQGIGDNKWNSIGGRMGVKFAW